MAIVKCKECGEDVSTNAKSCPKCGALAPKKTSLVTWFVLFLVVYGVYAANKETPRSTASSTPRASASSSSASSQSPVAPPTPAWRNTVSTDQLTGAKSSHASSSRVEPTRRMAFPYGDVEAWLGIGCDGKNEWAYVGFSDSPNLVDTDTKDGYNLISTRIRWNEVVESINLTQDWGASFLHFQNDGPAISKMDSSNAVLLELQWYGQQQTYFELSLNGSSAAIEAMRGQCSQY